MSKEQSKPITVVLADDHPIPRKAFADALTTYGIEVVGQANAPEEILAMYAELNPDVLVLDMRFGQQMTGIDVASELLKSHPDARVVFLSQFDQDTLIKRSYQLGAYAFVTKDCDPRTLLEAVQHAYGRTLYFMPNIAERLANLSVRGDRTPLSILEERELKIFKLMAQSRTITEIAEELGFSAKTVANASMAIKVKLGVHRPGELTLLAVKYQVIEP